MEQVSSVRVLSVLDAYVYEIRSFSTGGAIRLFELNWKEARRGSLLSG
jgi:hypothetical protein